MTDDPLKPLSPLPLTDLDPILDTPPREFETTPTKGDGLGNRTARGAAVTLGGQGVRMLLQFVSVIVLARLLSPQDYGLMAMVLVVVGIGEIFRDFGLSAAAIQSKCLTHAQRDNLFWINTGIGVILSVIVFLGASVVAELFGQPELAAITRVLAVTFIINGLATQYRAGLNRQLRFGPLAICDVLSQLFGLIVAVVLAAIGAGYWALVAQQLTAVLSVLVGVVAFGRWVPGLPSRGAQMKPFLRFGWNLMGTQLVGYTSNNLDTLTIGLRFGADSLGVYNRAFQLLMRPLNQLRIPTTSVAMPVLARLQHDIARSNGYVLRGQVAFGYTIVPGLALAAGASVPLVALFLGGQWAQVAPIVSLLAIAGICQTLSYVGYWVYISRGLTGHLFRYTCLTFVLQLICILIGSTWGVVGVAGGYAAAAVLEWPLSLWWLSRRTPLPAKGLWLGALRILACAIPAGLLAFGVTLVTSELPSFLSALCALLAGAALYGAAIWLVPVVRKDVAGVTDIVRRTIRR